MHLALVQIACLRQASYCAAALAIAACSASLPLSPPTNASEMFAEAINSQDLEGAMAHWSEDAELIFLTGSEVAAVATRDDIRQNYVAMFAEDNPPRLDIQVDGTERSGDVVHEWGLFTIGESTGCFVVVRRKSDGWEISREWIFQPCSR